MDGATTHRHLSPSISDGQEHHNASLVARASTRMDKGQVVRASGTAMNRAFTAVVSLLPSCTPEGSQ